MRFEVFEAFRGTSQLSCCHMIDIRNGEKAVTVLVYYFPQRKCNNIHSPSIHPTPFFCQQLYLGTVYLRRELENDRRLPEVPYAGHFQGKFLM
jgi:hypothetical protein